MKRDEPAQFKFAEIPQGHQMTASYELTESVYSSFLELSGDHSPIHVDEAEARRRGFDGRVMHGAILNAFLSHFVGMRLPGRHAMLQSVDIKYHQPVYLGDVLKFNGLVAQKVESVRVLVLQVKIDRVLSGELVASAKIQVGMAE